MKSRLHEHGSVFKAKKNNVGDAIIYQPTSLNKLCLIVTPIKSTWTKNVRKR